MVIYCKDNAHRSRIRLLDNRNQSFIYTKDGVLVCMCHRPFELCKKTKYSFCSYYIGRKICIMGLTFSWGYLLDIITCNCILLLKEVRMYLLLRSILKAALITQMPETLKSWHWEIGHCSQMHLLNKNNVKMIVRRMCKYFPLIWVTDYESKIHQ